MREKFNVVSVAGKSSQRQASAAAVWTPAFAGVTRWKRPPALRSSAPSPEAPMLERPHLTLRARSAERRFGALIARTVLIGNVACGSNPAVRRGPGAPSVGLGRVGVWRGDVRLSMRVAAPFVWRCLSGSTVAPSPHSPHRTGQADLPHPALGQDLTPSSTARRTQAGSAVRARSARRGARVDSSRPCVA